MSFTADNVSGGPALLKFSKDGQYLKRGSEEAYNDQAFIAKVHEARAGYLKFNGGDDPPERRMGSIFPVDAAPARASLGDTDESQWKKGKFGIADPWTPCVEIPLVHKDTGEELVFTTQSKTGVGAALDFIAQAKRVPDGFLPVISLGVAAYKSKFGPQKKPALIIKGRVPVSASANGATVNETRPFDDPLQF